MTDSTPPDYEESEPTGRTIAIRHAGARGDVGELARAVERMQRSIDGLTASEQQRVGAAKEQARSTSLWRWAGGIAAGVAITIGATGVQLGSTASADHDRLGVVIVEADRHEKRVDELVAEVGAVQRQQAGTSATLVEVRAALVDLRDEVRALRREAAERERRR